MENILKDENYENYKKWRDNKEQYLINDEVAARIRASVSPPSGSVR
jgi:hypothetical protein